MPDLTFKEHVQVQPNYWSKGIKERGEELEALLKEALDRQRDEFMKCLPKDYEMDRDVFIGFENYRDQFLDNLKKAKLIE